MDGLTLRSCESVGTRRVPTALTARTFPSIRLLTAGPSRVSLDGDVIRLGNDAGIPVGAVDGIAAGRGSGRGRLPLGTPRRPIGTRGWSKQNAVAGLMNARSASDGLFGPSRACWERRRSGAGATGMTMTTEAKLLTAVQTPRSASASRLHTVASLASQRARVGQ